MAHGTARSGYDQLIKRLNKHPQGAPPSEILNKILGLLFSEKEASLAALLPIKPFSVGTAARAWKMKEAEAQKILDALAGRAILIDIAGRKRQYYALPPPMAAILGVILKLPPLKQAMASRQMKSRYLDTLIARLKL